MRILLTHHFPLEVSPAGSLTLHLARQLEAAGHEVRVLVVDSRRPREDEGLVRRVVCSPDTSGAELDFSPPGFEPQPGLQQTFDQLTDEGIGRYRDVLRDVLDEEIDEFQPDLVHSQHIWIFGHLALEAGAPYVLTAWGPELSMCRRDDRYLRFAQEAAENAGRILVASDSLRSTVIELFGELDGRVTTLDIHKVPATIAIYRDVLRARLGREPAG